MTHLPQVAACADHHCVVRKAAQGGSTRSQVDPVIGEARVQEIARMLGGGAAGGTSLAHAQALLAAATSAPPASSATAGGRGGRKRQRA